MRIPLHFNQSLSMRVPGTSAWIPSTVLSHVEDRELVVRMPQSLPPGASLQVGMDVAVELALPDGLRRFSVPIKGIGATPPALRLAWPEEGERIQRREAVRVSVDIPVTVQVVGDGDSLGPVIAGMTSYISAGGVRLKLPVYLSANTIIRVVIDAPDSEELECTGRVLRQGELTRMTGPNRFWVAVVFAEIAPAVLREINKMVLDIQRTQIRRGAL